MERRKARSLEKEVKLLTERVLSEAKKSAETRKRKRCDKLGVLLQQARNKEFYEALQRMNPKPRLPVPKMVCHNDRLLHRRGEVLEAWRSQYANILNNISPANRAALNKSLHADVLARKGVAKPT